MSLSRASTIPGLRLLLVPRVQLIAAVALLAVVVTIRLGQLVQSSAALDIGYDFSAYWVAGRQLLEGSSVYSAEQLAGPYPAQRQFMFLYPPFLAVVVAPLALAFAAYVPAAWAWAAGGLVVLVAAVLAIARLGGHAWPVTLLLLALALALPPVALELYMGNVHLLLLGLLGLAWLGVRQGGSGGDTVAGVAIACASLIKVFPVVIIGWLWLTDRRRAAALAVASCIVLVLATLPITGVSDWLAYPRVLANLAPPTDMSNVLAPSVWLGELIGSWPARLAVMGIGAVVVVWSARRQPAPLSYAVAVLVSLLVVPALYMHYLALAVLPLLLMASEAGAWRRALVAYGALFAGTQLALWDPLSTEARAAATIAALIFLTLLVWSGRRHGPIEARAAGGGG